MSCRPPTIGRGIYGLVHKHFLNTLVVPGTGLGTKNLVPALRELTNLLREVDQKIMESDMKCGNARDNDCWECRKIQNAKTGEGFREVAFELDLEGEVF